MKVVVAPDKFRSSLSALEAAGAIAEGVLRADASAAVDLCPLADGGEGTVAALVAATHGTFHSARVTGPLAEMKVDAQFGISGDGQTAFIEMAAASGLALLPPDQRNPMYATTFGAGELLMAAAKLGVRRIILGIGGSATVDGGIGCSQACQLPVILRDGEPLSPTEPLTASDLDRVVLIKHGRGSPIERVELLVACDVTNPLYGPNGAAAVFGPQKGATPQQIEILDQSLRGLAQRTGKLELANVPGAGAAGGLGFAMLAYFNAKLRPGIELVIEAVELEKRLAGADVCITGEGKFDASTLSGKAPAGVAELCRRLGIPCIALAGVMDPDTARAAVQMKMFQQVAALHDDSRPVEESIANAARLLADLSEQVVKQRVSEDAGAAHRVRPNM